MYMRSRVVRVLVASAFAVLMAAGCASTELLSRRRDVGNEKLPRPGRVIVYDFAATPDDISADSAIAGSYDRRETPQSAEDIVLGRRLSDILAKELVRQIRELGMSAKRAGAGEAPRENDLLIRGQFVSMEEGSRTKRMLIGFGAGKSHLQTLVQGYQMGADGPRRLGELEIEAAGGKMPGMLVPVAGGAAGGRAATSAAVSGGMNVAQERGAETIEDGARRTAEQLAAILSRAFARQGWISASMAK